jgi:predicted transcriptional regulator
MQLKPQDFLVAFKLVAWGEQRWTYARLAQELGISVSEAHACIKRGLQAGLLLPNREMAPQPVEAGSSAALSV